MLKIPRPKPPPQVEPRMHVVACKNCPSAHHAPDPEVQEIMALSFADRLQTVFPCGWNPKRYCRGYCETMGVTNIDLQELASTQTV